MARSRLLKPGFFTNETLAELPYEARLCFAGLWTLADREGRLEDRPKRITAALFPYDVVDMSGLLDALALKGFIRRYVSDGQAVIDLPTFSEHQSPHPKEAKSQLPKYQSVTREPRKDTASSVNSDTSPSVSILISDPVSIPVSEAVEKPVLVPASPDTHTARPRGVTLFSGKDHLAHAACGRVCIPAFLHREFVRALGGRDDIADETGIPPCSRRSTTISRWNLTRRSSGVRAFRARSSSLEVSRRSMRHASRGNVRILTSARVQRFARTRRI